MSIAISFTVCSQPFAAPFARRGMGMTAGPQNRRPRGSGCNLPFRGRMSGPRPVARGAPRRFADPRAARAGADAACQFTGGCPARARRMRPAVSRTRAPPARERMRLAGGCPARPRRMRPAVSRTRATPARERIRLAGSQADVRPVPGCAGCALPFRGPARRPRGSGCGSPFRGRMSGPCPRGGTGAKRSMPPRPSAQAP